MAKDLTAKIKKAEEELREKQKRYEFVKAVKGIKDARNEIKLNLENYEKEIKSRPGKIPPEKPYFNSIPHDQYYTSRAIVVLRTMLRNKSYDVAQSVAEDIIRDYRGPDAQREKFYIHVGSILVEYAGKVDKEHLDVAKKLISFSKMCEERLSQMKR